MRLSLATAFFILVMYLFGPGGVLGHHPGIIYDLFGLYTEHEDWYEDDPVGMPSASMARPAPDDGAEVDDRRD